MQLAACTKSCGSSKISKPLKGRRHSSEPRRSTLDHSVVPEGQSCPKARVVARRRVLPEGECCPRASVARRPRVAGPGSDLNQGPANLQSAALTTELCTPPMDNAWNKYPNELASPSGLLERQTRPSCKPGWAFISYLVGVQQDCRFPL